MINRRLIDFLSDGRFHSGSEIGGLLQVSRAAVWKQIKKLTDFGLIVHAVPGKGYQIPGGIDLLDAEKIQAGLSPSVVSGLGGLMVLDAVESPADLALSEFKRIGGVNPFLVAAESRVLGKVKYGRGRHTNFGSSLDLAVASEWSGEVGGLSSAALSVVATLKVLESLGAGVGSGLNGKVRWPADLMVSEKRLGGVDVRLESVSSGRQVLVLGVRLWVRSSSYMRPNEEGAACLQDVLGLKSVLRNPLSARLFESLLEVVAMDEVAIKSTLEKWRRYDCLRDREVMFDSAGRSVKGYVLGIDEVGRLRLETSEGISAFSPADTGGLVQVD